MRNHLASQPGFVFAQVYESEGGQVLLHLRTRTAADRRAIIDSGEMQGVYRQLRGIATSHAGFYRLIESVGEVPRRLAALAGLLVFALLPATAGASPPYVAVKGNRLVNEGGETIRLLGVDRSGAEYECLGGQQVFDGPVDEASVAAIASWHINAVRVPLNEDCWLGINGMPTAVGGLAYQQRDRAVRAERCNAARDRTRSSTSTGRLPGTPRRRAERPMADADHTPEVLDSVRRTPSRRNPAVIFDLFNEPYQTTTWSCVAGRV